MAVHSIGIRVFNCSDIFVLFSLQVGLPYVMILSIMKRVYDNWTK